MGSYKDLRVWQQGMRLTVAVYEATRKFPREEIYGLTSQLRRAAVSVPSNIAEGKGRHSDREFVHFLLNARGSLLELETQVELARQLKYLDDIATEAILVDAAEVGRGINALINKFRSNEPERFSRRPTTDD